MFHYFVSYAFSGSTNGIGFGCCGVQRDKPITKMTEIQDVVTELAERMPNLGNFTVLNFQLLREEPDAE